MVINEENASNRFVLDLPTLVVRADMPKLISFSVDFFYSFMVRTQDETKANGAGSASC